MLSNGGPNPSHLNKHGDLFTQHKPEGRRDSDHTADYLAYV